MTVNLGKLDIKNCIHGTEIAAQPETNLGYVNVNLLCLRVRKDAFEQLHAASYAPKKYFPVFHCPCRGEKRE